MKINPGVRPFGNVRMTDANPSNAVQPKSFSDAMQYHNEKATEDQLKQMIDQIHKQADRLLKSMTIRELRLYKQYVKQFLEETARRGIRLRDTKGWDRRGRTKRYKLLDEIDGTLLQMADDLLDSEQGRILILQQVGEIRGLLINLAF